MIDELKNYFLENLERAFEVINGLPDYPQKKFDIEDNKHKRENIDEYTAYKMSQIATKLLDAKARGSRDFEIAFDTLPAIMKTQAVFDYCDGLSKEICGTKGYQPYDLCHQELYEKFGFTEVLPTFEEIRNLEYQLNSLRNSTPYPSEDCDKLLHQIMLKKQELGELEEQKTLNAPGYSITRMRQDLLNQFPDLSLNAKTL